jgi:hypothetical protein
LGGFLAFIPSPSASTETGFVAAHRHATEQRDELATFQLIEFHFGPLPSRGRIAGYRNCGE